MNEKQKLAEIDCSNPLELDDAQVFSLFTQCSQDYFWICSIDLTLSYVSPNVFAQTGFTAEEYRNTTLEQRFPPESIAHIKHTLASAMEHGFGGAESSGLLVLECYRADGSTYWSQISYNFLRDDHGKVTGVFGTSHDITNRKAAQDALTESEEKYRMLFEANHDSTSICYVEEDGSLSNFVEINAAGAAIVGYTKEEMLGKSIRDFRDLFTPEEKQQLLHEIQTQGSVRFATKLRKKDGSFIDVDIKASLINYNGRPALLNITRNITQHMQDIKDLRQAKDEIQQSEQKYRELYSLMRLMADTMPDMLWAKDLERKYIFVNKAICEKLLCAESIDEPLGKTDMFFAERQRAEKPNDPDWHTFGEVCRDTDSITLAAMQISSFEESGNIRGKHSVLDVHKAPLIDDSGKLIGVVGSGRDITEQKTLQQELRRESEFRKLIMDISAEFLKPALELSDSNINASLIKVAEFWHADRAYIFDYNPGLGLCSIKYEWCRDGIRNVFQDYLEEPLLPDWKASFTEGDMFYVPNVAELKEGETKAILENSEVKSMVSIPLLSEDECFGFIGFDMISDYHRYSEIDLQLLQMFVEMLANLRLRKGKHLELIAAKEKALESDRIKSSFLANMSHELRTPLNGILGFSELLTNILIEPDGKDMATMIFSSGKRLLRTLDMILDISRIEANKLDIRLQSFDVCRNLQQTIRLYLPLAQSKGLSITFVPRVNPLPLSSDPDIFNRIMDELLYNAIKYTFEGGISIDTEQIIHNRQSCIQIQISDTGIGIPRDRINIIFEAFRQASEGLSRNHEGTGLGLTLSRKYTELLGGQIKAKSKPGVGSTFTLLLPQLCPESEELAASKEDSDQNPVPKIPAANILLIDDDELGCLLTAKQLPPSFKLDTVQSGHKGLERLKSKDYDLLLLDINLKDSYSGIDLLQDIRKIPKLAKLPVIAITAYAMTGDRERFLSVGFDGYISKPVSNGELLNIVLKQLKK
jgi:PAS domain S-box-containing protein